MKKLYHTRNKNARETLIFADDVYEEDNILPLRSEHSLTMAEICEEYVKRKKEKEEKKKKRKKHKRKADATDLPTVFMGSYLRPFFQESFIRRGQEIPSSLIFNLHQESAFFFGRTKTGCCVGKNAEEDGHIAIFGGSGIGKTTGIAIPTMITWKGSIFSFDFKGDLIGWTKKRRSLIFYLLSGVKNYFYYDPFYLLREDGEENEIQNARELAQAIIPMPNEIRDLFWIMAARDVLTGAIIYYFHLGLDFIKTMITIKTTPMTHLIEKICSDDVTAVCVNPDLALNPKTLAGVSMELHNHIAVFATDSVIQEAFSPSKEKEKGLLQWEDLEKYDIFIRVDQSRLEQWSSVVRLLLVQLTRTLERRPEKHTSEGGKVKPTLLMLDEFPQYGKIDTITSALKVLRSKNVTISLFCQSLADLDESYGAVTRRAILDNCPYQAILSAYDAETQQYFSNLIGMEKVPSRGVSANFDPEGQNLGYSATINESCEPVIYPHEFASLSDIVLLYPGAGRFCRVEKELSFRRNIPLKEERLPCRVGLSSALPKAKPMLPGLSGNAE